MEDLLEVSVVVPVYNGESTISLCIEALLQQTKIPAEIIIVDNNSRDGTREIIQKYPVTLLQESIQTSYAARNTGVKHARTGLVALTDADCIAASDWLEKLTNPFDADGILAVAGRIADSPPTTLAERFILTNSPFADVNPHKPPALLTANAAYRRAAVAAVGWFDEALPTAGDVDMGWRLRASGNESIARAADAIVYHKHRTTWKGLFNQYKRYGYSEILLTTLYRQTMSDAIPPGEQTRRMLRQVKALVVYLLSFGWRLVRYPFRRGSRDWLVWPLLWFTVEFASLVGKVKGLVRTRWYRRNPYQSRLDIRRGPTL